MAKPDPKNRAPQKKSFNINDLRQKLLHLLLGDKSSESLIATATQIATQTLGCPCVYSPNPSDLGIGPASIRLDLNVGDACVGQLVLGDRASPLKGIEEETLNELADLFSVVVHQAEQTNTIAELQDESADMLYFAPDAIYVVGDDGTVAMANRQALTFLGKSAEEVEGESIWELIGPLMPSIPELKTRARAGDTVELEVSCPRGTRLASITLSEVGCATGTQLLCVVRDITSERQSQLALRHIERSILMAQIVDYVLHEVNNPLSALLASTTLASRQLKNRMDTSAVLNGGSSYSAVNYPSRETNPTQLTSLIGNAHSAGMRIRQAMATLRTTLRKTHTSTPGQIEVGFELGLAIAAMRQEYGHSIPVVSQIDQLPSIQSPPLALAEAFAAILRNAIQAVSSRADGRIEIDARADDDRIQIAIEDNGPGIDPQIQKQIFMPFFTTKPLATSHGLGLTMARDAIGRIGGKIQVDQSFSAGTRMVITLPCSKESTLNRVAGSYPRVS